MKKAFILGILTLLFSCDDGDLQIETIDFDSFDIQTCATVTTDTEIFFKTNTDEALILELQSGILKNEASTATIESVVGTASKLTYRIFSDDVSNPYFCSEVPVTEPNVISEIKAASGKVLITTIAIDDTTFEHTIQLSDISFITDTDARITNLEINNFGTVTTIKSE